MFDKKPNTDSNLKASLEAFSTAFPDYKKTVAEPVMYDVVLLNDDFTPHEYVLSVLNSCFHLDHDTSVHMIIMMQQHGEVICGTYTKEVAETKMIDIINLSRDCNHPLKCMIRKETD